MALTKVGKEGITGVSNSSDATAITIDSSENVGIGTNSPISNSTTNLQIHGGTASGSSELRLTNADTGATASDGLQLQMYQGTEAYINNRENGPIIFKTNNTEEMRLLAGGGLTFNGDTAAANALDDYEFGDYDITLTPSSSGSITPSSGENKASYVKIGNFVQAQGRVTVSSVSSPAGDLAINLPFTTTSSQGEASGSGAPALFVWNSTQTNNGLWAGFFDKSISAFYIRWGNSSTPGHSASYIQASTEIRFSVSYITDS